MLLNENPRDGVVLYRVEDDMQLTKRITTTSSIIEKDVLNLFPQHYKSSCLMKIPEMESLESGCIELKMTCS